MESEKCYGEENGIQGCAACSLISAYLGFLRGEGLSKECGPKVKRYFTAQQIDDLTSGKAIFNSAQAIFNL